MQTAGKVEDFREDWRPTPEKVELAVKKAIEVARPSRVFIFGSWARGEASESSDLDLAVFLPDSRNAELGQVRSRVAQELRDIPMSIDLIVASEGYVAEFLSSVNSVYYRIVRRGKLVYDSGNR
jgi:predicted nucleotidyltransferase